jgi:hypothetical protein
MPRRYSPFKITKKISPVAYQLDLLQSMKIHNVFHVDLLSPYKETEAYGTPYMRCHGSKGLWLEVSVNVTCSAQVLSDSTR